MFVQGTQSIFDTDDLMIWPEIMLSTIHHLQIQSHTLLADLTNIRHHSHMVHPSYPWQLLTGEKSF